MTKTPRLVLLTLLLGALLATGGTASAGPTPNRDSDGASSVAVDTAASERKVIALTNKRRKDHGCKPLAYRSPLRKAARRHTHRMVEAGSLDHQLPGEPALGRRVTNAGYKNWTMVAENIAAGYSTPKAVVRAWMGSSGHRANILNCRLKHIGVGLVVADDGVAWWTQVFGRK